jgi:hypothetical protein
MFAVRELRTSLLLKDLQTFSHPIIEIFPQIVPRRTRAATGQRWVKVAALDALAMTAPGRRIAAVIMAAPVRPRPR